MSDLPEPDQGRTRTPRRTVVITGRPDRKRGGSRSRRPLAELERRRPPRSAHERVGTRPDRIAMWALMMGLLLVLVAATSAHAAPARSASLHKGDSGARVAALQRRLKRAGFLHDRATGFYGPATASAVRRYQRSRCLTADGIAGPVTIRALRRHARSCRAAHRGRHRPTIRPGPYVRRELGARTLARGMRGRDVRTLQRLLGLPPTGYFGSATNRAVRRFQRRAGLGADGIVGRATRGTLIGRRMGARTATWYGPGLYGNRTACGYALTPRLRGIAHRSLPCGRRVTLYYHGRFAYVRVVDRGPYTSGVTLDLTAATARSLGLSGTDRVRARY